jgi:hypothetical protein
MWDKDDHSSRWVQGVCAVPLIAWCLFGFSLVSSPSYNLNDYEKTAVEVSMIGAAYVACRCLWYAINGSGSINRDDY